MTKLFIIPFVLLMAASVQAAWTPPAKPDPDKILTEAQADAKAKRFADALAKHEWFWGNAVKHDPNNVGTRVSFALMYWRELGDVYPPAMRSMKAARDLVERDVRAGKDEIRSFQDFIALNDNLGGDSKSVELFEWLDVNKPNTANLVYTRTQDSLVKAKRYELCGKYVDADCAMRSVVSSFRTNREFTTKPEFAEVVAQGAFSDKPTFHGACTVVALLVRGDRKAEAAKVAAEFVKERSDPDFLAALEKAKAGEVPKPWR